MRKKTNKNNALPLLNVKQSPGLARKGESEVEAERILVSALQNKRLFALVLLELNNVGSIEATMDYRDHGELLPQIISQLKNHLAIFRFNEVAAWQLSGKFIVLTSEFDNMQELGRFCRQVLVILRAPIEVYSKKIAIVASAGIATCPEAGKTIKKLLASARLALSQAQQECGGGYKYFTRKLYEASRRHALLEAALREAVNKKQFRLVFQPQIRFSDLKVVGAEALLRWHGPGGEEISPEEFIPVAESAGEMQVIGEWVFAEACRLWQELKLQKVELPVLGLNLSSAQLNQVNLSNRINEIVHNAGLSGGEVVLEVTETSAMLGGNDAINSLVELSNSGFELSIDDFGTGYSSLMRLKSLPFNSLKIDKSFVKHMMEEESSQHITTAIIAMAKSFGLSIVAEGVESEEQFNILRFLGCDVAQGYFFSEPLEFCDFVDYLESKK